MSGRSIRLSISDAFYNKKINVPKQIAYGTSFYPVNLSREDLFVHITRGKAFMPAMIKGHTRTKDQFVQSQILALDFDHGPDLETLLADSFIKEYAWLIYQTPSSTPEAPRHRVVFILSEAVTCADRWETLQRALIQHFAPLNPDTACKDASRIWCGSTKPDPYINPDATLPIEVADDLTLIEAERVNKLEEAVAKVEPFSQQTTSTGGKLSPELVVEVKRHLKVDHAAYNAKGYTVKAIQCPMKHHEHDAEQPAAHWHEDKNILICFKCGRYYLLHEVAAALGIDVASFYRHDRIPDDPSVIKVSHRYITDHNVMGLLEDGITTLLIKSPTGSGKTELIKQLTERYQRILVISHRRSLIRSQVKRLNENLAAEDCFVSYEEVSLQELRQADRLCICINSLHKLMPIGEKVPEFDVIVFDELEQQHKHIVGRTLENDQPVDVLFTMKHLMQHSKIVVGLDAYATVFTVEWMKASRGEETFRMLLNQYPVNKGQMTLVSTFPELITQANEYLYGRRLEGPIVFAVASKSLAKLLYSYYTGETKLSSEENDELLKTIDPSVLSNLRASGHRITPSEVIIITGDETDSMEASEFIRDINDRMPQLKILIYNSAMGTGVDIQAPVEAVFGVFSSGILPADECMQMLARCRKASQFYVCLQGGVGHRETDHKRLYQAQIDNINMTGCLLESPYRVGWSINASKIMVPDDKHIDYLQYWSRVTSRINLAHNGLHSEFCAIAKAEYAVEDLRHLQLREEDIDPEQADIIEVLAQVKKGVAGIDKHLVLTCTPITRSNYQQLQSGYQVSPAVLAGYLRWTIERGYRQPITPEIYDHWLKGGLRHLNQYIDLYSRDADLQLRDMQQAFAGYAIPQRDHVTSRTKLIRSVLKLVFGSYRNLESSEYLTDDEIHKRLAPFITKNAITLWRTFNWRSAHDGKAISVLRRILQQLGLNLECSRKGITRGKYGISRDSLSEMQRYYEAYHATSISDAESEDMVA